MKGYGTGGNKAQKAEKFDFEKMRIAATHQDRSTRKKSFVEYFARFEEFPSYLFDNTHEVDDRLRTTIEDLLADPETSKELRKGLDMLRQRLPSFSEDK